MHIIITYCIHECNSQRTILNVFLILPYRFRDGIRFQSFASYPLCLQLSLTSITTRLKSFFFFSIWSSILLSTLKFNDVSLRADHSLCYKYVTYIGKHFLLFACYFLLLMHITTKPYRNYGHFSFPLLQISIGMSQLVHL